MISIEVLRRYPFFAGFNRDHLTHLAKNATEKSVLAGRCFHSEGDELNKFYIVQEGIVAIMIEIPDRKQTSGVDEQPTGRILMKDITVSNVTDGDMFGWSALVPPHKSTAKVRAVTDCRVIEFDCEQLRPIFEEDCKFAYLMMLKAAQTIRRRLRDMRMEALAEIAERAVKDTPA